MVWLMSDDSNKNDTDYLEIIAEDLKSNNLLECKENDSGKGVSSVLPDQLKRLNFGAFFLSPFWGYAHKIKLGYFALATYVIWILSIALFYRTYTTQNYYILTVIRIEIDILLTFSFIFLFKGNEMAWRSCHFESIKQFKAVNRTWLFWGITVTILRFLLAFIVFCLMLIYH